MKRADWWVILAATLAVLTLFVTCVGMWELYSPRAGDTPHRVLRVDGADGRRLVPLSAKVACVYVRIDSGQGRFIVAQLRDDRPLVYIGERQLYKDSIDSQAREPIRENDSSQSCVGLNGLDTKKVRLEELGYAPCAIGNCAIGSDRKVLVTTKHLRFQPGRLIAMSGLLWASALLFFYYGVCDATMRRRDVTAIVLALSGILFVRFGIALNTVMASPGFADRVVVIGLELLLVPPLLGFLFQRIRLRWQPALAFSALAGVWLWWTLQDGVIGEFLEHRFGQLLQVDRNQLWAAISSLVVPLAELSMIVLLALACATRRRIALGSGGRSLSFRVVAILAVALLVASALAIVGEGNLRSTGDALQRLPYLSAAVGLFGFGALLVAPNGGIRQRYLWISLLGGALLLLVGVAGADRGTSIVAGISVLLALAMAWANMPHEGLPRSTVTIIVVVSCTAVVVLAVVTSAMAWKLVTLLGAAHDISEKRERPVAERMGALGDAAAKSPLVDMLTLCSLPGSVSELTAQRANAIDDCFAKNYVLSGDESVGFQAAGGHASKTRLYAWLYGQPLRGVWTQTAIENMSGYVQGLANSVPTPGATLLYGDRALPSATNFQNRNRRDGLDFEWLTGLRWVRPFGICGMVLLLSCYVIMYRSLDDARDKLPAKIVIAAFGCASAWGLIQTQGVLPFTGFSVPLLTFTSFARDWLPNFTVLIGTLMYALVRDGSDGT